MENEPVLGEIRKGKDIGKTHGIYYIWFACIECGVPQWVGLRHGRPRNTRCHDCAIRKPWKEEHRRNHEKAIKEMQQNKEMITEASHYNGQLSLRQDTQKHHSFHLNHPRSEGIRKNTKRLVVSK